MRSTRTRSSAIIMERDEAFQLASSRVLPASIQAELDNTERYAIGNVVYNPAKPTIVSWRKQSVQFAQLDDGNPVGVKNIVAPESERLLSQLRTQSTLFSSTGRRETTKEFTIKLSDENQTLIKASFGAIYQSTSNLLGLLRSSGSNLLKADLGNPIVQRVVENGGQFYVISTVYEAERVEISVRIDDDSDHETHWNSVVTEAEKRVISFLLVQLSISSDGTIRPVLHGGYIPRSISIEEAEDGVADVGGDFEDVDTAYKYLERGRRELQVFQSQTYSGLIDEAAVFVEALRVNRELQGEFIALLRKQRSQLVKLGQELQTLQESVVVGAVEKEPPFPELMVQLSTKYPHRLDQIKALGFATEAFKELSPVTVKRILSLSEEEKKTLYDLFKELPLNSSTHVFSRPAFPEDDELYSQILVKIGFADSNGRLSYETDESGVDFVAVAITAILASSSA